MGWDRVCHGSGTRTLLACSGGPSAAVDGRTEGRRDEGSPPREVDSVALCRDKQHGHPGPNPELSPAVHTSAPAFAAPASVPTGPAPASPGSWGPSAAQPPGSAPRTRLLPWRLAPAGRRGLGKTLHQQPIADPGLPPPPLSANGECEMPWAAPSGQDQTALCKRGAWNRS